jgi:hypothetical protein
LSYLKIRTVEELAAINDGNMNQVGPYLALRQVARDWLENAKSTAPVSELRAKNVAMTEELKTLRDIVKEMGDQIEFLKSSKKAK